MEKHRDKLPERLKKLRKEKGISQEELAQVVSISKSSINMYERGEREPGIDTLIAIAEYFRVSVDYLVGRKDMTIQKAEKEQKLEILYMPGNYIKTIRNELGLSTKEVSDAVGVSEDVVARWEIGVPINGLKREQFDALAEVLQCTFEDIIANSERRYFLLCPILNSVRNNKLDLSERNIIGEIPVQIESEEVGVSGMIRYFWLCKDNEVDGTKTKDYYLFDISKTDIEHYTGQTMLISHNDGREAMIREITERNGLILVEPTSWERDKNAVITPYTKADFSKVQIIARCIRSARQFVYPEMRRKRANKEG